MRQRDMSKVAAKFGFFFPAHGSGPLESFQCVSLDVHRFIKTQTVVSCPLCGSLHSQSSSGKHKRESTLTVPVLVQMFASAYESGLPLGPLAAELQDRCGAEQPSLR